MCQQGKLRFLGWRRKVGQKLRELPSHLPYELKLCIMDQFMAANPIRLDKVGRMLHVLLDEDEDTFHGPNEHDEDTFYGISNDLVTIMFRAAPLLVVRELNRDRAESWLHSVRLWGRHGPREDIILNRMLIPYKTIFLSVHDTLRGRNQRSRIRVKFRWTFHTTCLRECRITCHGNDTPIQHFAPGPACSSRVCICSLTTTELLQYIPGILREVAQRWDLPIENVELEILMKHSCESKACFGHHIWYTIRYLTSLRNWLVYLVTVPLIASWFSIHTVPQMRTMFQTIHNESPSQRAWWLRVVLVVIPIGVMILLLKPPIWSLQAFGNWLDRQTWLDRTLYTVCSAVVEVKTAIESTLKAVGWSMATAVILPFICIFAICRVTHDRLGRQ